MNRYLSTVVLFACFAASITGSAQGQAPSGIGAKGIALEISIVETDGVRVNELAKVPAVKEEVNRLIASGKARLIASLEVRTRTGENFSAKVGQRIPIQTATLPAVRTSERPPRDSREPLQSQGASIAFPQIEYENTGLVVEGIAMPAGEGLMDIKLKIEVTGLDHSTGTLTPTFTQRTFSDGIRMKESESAMLIGFVQPASRSLSLEEIASGASKAAGSGLVVVLTTKSTQ